MAYQMAATAATLYDPKGHSSVAGYFKCNSSNICAAFYAINGGLGHQGFLATANNRLHYSSKTIRRLRYVTITLLLSWQQCLKWSKKEAGSPFSSPPLEVGPLNSLWESGEAL